MDDFRQSGFASSPEEFDEEEYDDYAGGEEDLMHIFEYYASYGEPLPTAELHASKVTTMLNAAKRITKTRVHHTEMRISMTERERELLIREHRKRRA